MPSLIHDERGLLQGTTVMGIDMKGKEKLERIRVGVVGARGYSGLELCRLLLGHPFVQLVSTFNRDASWQLGHDLAETGAPHLVPNHSVDRIFETINEIDVLFLATPAETSQKLVQQIYKTLNPANAPKIIDLSGGFRLDPVEYEVSYQQKHLASEYKAIYGLVPWQSPSELARHHLIANPGCYATSVLLALIPLVKWRLLDTKHLVIDAKSGVTGAGRGAKEQLLFSELFANFYPYKIGKHQHEPEILSYLQAWGGQAVDIQFTTHLLPVPRGILSSIYGVVNRASDSPVAGMSDDEITAAINEAYQISYQDYPLVDVQAYASESLMPGDLQLSKIVGQPLTRIFYFVKNQKIYVFSLIDNLLKGAASQAIENLNISFGWPVTSGLMAVTKEQQ